ncbi:hypothetical protein RMCBS344292_04807 [Rhizopus microsporus]|nr:hypothetical protein RMCBS344292_04807 [Rhizopus microsporus]
MYRSYCTGVPYASVQGCHGNTAAYNWATTPGFNQMLPGYASSRRVDNLFTTNFILYFVGAGLSFFLWLASLFSLCSFKRRGGRGFSMFMSSATCLTFFVMLAALIIALILVITSVKAIGSVTQDWQGHAGISIWFTIGMVISLLLAFLCYCLRACFRRRTVEPRKSAYRKSAPFALQAHAPATYPMQQYQQPYYYQQEQKPEAQDGYVASQHTEQPQGGYMASQHAEQPQGDYMDSQHTEQPQGGYMASQHTEQPQGGYMASQHTEQPQEYHMYQHAESSQAAAQRQPDHDQHYSPALHMQYLSPVYNSAIHPEGGLQHS